MTWKARRERRRSQAAWGPCGSQEAPDARGQDPTPTADEVERGDEVGTTDLVAPRPAHITARSACPDSLEPAETGQNTPVSIQKPTSWDDHDVGLSAMQLVGLARGLSSHEAGLLCEAGGVSAVHLWECISVA